MTDKEFVETYQKGKNCVVMINREGGIIVKIKDVYEFYHAPTDRIERSMLYTQILTDTCSCCSPKDIKYFLKKEDNPEYFL